MITTREKYEQGDRATSEKIAGIYIHHTSKANDLVKRASRVFSFICVFQKKGITIISKDNVLRKSPMVMPISPSMCISGSNMIFVSSYPAITEFSNQVSKNVGIFGIIFRTYRRFSNIFPSALTCLFFPKKKEKVCHLY